jgi:hypothetical protein
MNHETLLDIGKFVEEIVTEPWTSCSDPIYLYHNEHSRLAVQPQTSMNFEGTWRHNRLADHGIYSPELDGETLGRTFVEQVCHHLSIKDMMYLVKHLQQAIDAQEENIKQHELTSKQKSQ